MKAGAEGKPGSAAPVVVSNMVSEGGEDGQNTAEDDEVDPYRNLSTSDRVH